MARWRRWITAGVLALLVGGVLTHRHELADAGRRIGGLSPGWLAVLALTAAAGILADGVFASTVTPTLSVRRATMVQQAATAANNTVVGSGPVATGLRVAMLRSWQVPDGAIGLTIVALNLVASYSVWLVALATAVVGLLGAAPEVLDRRVYLAVAAAAVVVVASSTALWWVLLRHPVAARWLACRAQRLFDAARRRVRRLPALDLPGIVERSRLDACRLARAHGHRIVFTAVVEQLVNLATPLVVVRAFGIGPDVLTTSEVLVAYGLVRLGAALTPVPAGIGVTELGLATLLTRFGGPDTEVLAAVLTYRAITFLLPLLVGAVSFVAWRWSRRVAGLGGGGLGGGGVRGGPPTAAGLSSPGR